ncbi:hypothetical protein GQ600_19635 [Phytophthora cactorum]|nr:hypothetical protein GQ600_19635 [Phytophthora cactorum]
MEAGWNQLKQLLGKKTSIARCTGKPSHTPDSSVVLASKKRIAYVRLKKGASSKHTVLSECEKYNVVRAEVIALVDGLQQLSSSKFYEIFADLRATVDIFKKKWDLDQISLLHPGVSDDDEDHDFDFDDSGEKGESTVEQVAQLPDENETDAPVAPDDLSQCVMMNPSQVSLPDIVVSEQSQETLQLEATTSPTPELEAHPADTLEMLKLPASSNARAKDLRKGSKWAITEFGSGCPIHLGAFVKWMASTCDLDYVVKISTKYPICYKQSLLLSRSPTVLQNRSCEVVNAANFVIPMKLMKRVNSPLLTWMRLQIWTLHKMMLCQLHFWLLKWAASPSGLVWSISNATCVLGKHARGGWYLKRPKLLNFFRQSSLSRTFVTPSGPTGRCITSTPRDLVGKVARNRRLNDAAMDAGLWHVSKYSTNCYAVDAVSVSDEKIFFPDFLQLCAGTNSHECSGALDGADHRDPNERCGYEQAQDLGEWFDRDAGGEKLLNFQSTRRRGSSPTTDNASANTTPFVQQRVLPEVVAVPLLYPKQTDSVSCGMLSIAQAYSYVRHVRSLKTSKSIPQNDIAQMRLRLLWTLLHESSAADEDKDVQVWPEMVDVRKKIKKAFDSA